jgi:GntR family transcriptional regulator, rspAB operon transcriptional repressor
VTAGGSSTKRAKGTELAVRALGKAPKLEWQTVWDIVEAAGSEKPEPPSRNSQTYSSIKRMILFGQLGPGRKLVHEELAEALKVSRTPVREALERLYQEGFVTRLPRRGFYVTGITRDEAYGLYGAREALELFALQVTLERGPLPRGALNTLAVYAKRYEDLINTQMLTERILADMLFHLKLAELSGNRYVVRLLAQTFERSALKRRHEGYRYDRSKLAATEHTQLLDALTKHDKRAAMQALRKHVQSARDALLSQLYEVPPLSFDPI